MGEPCPCAQRPTTAKARFANHQGGLAGIPGDHPELDGGNYDPNCFLPRHTSFFIQFKMPSEHVHQLNANTYTLGAQ